jgi:HK97 gp10 family phage protein
MNNKNQIVCKVDLQMNGVAEKLEDLGPKIGRKLLRKALKAAGAIWVEEVKQRAPTLLGDLRDAIAMRVRTKKSRKNPRAITGSVEVGPDISKRRSDDKKSVGPGIYAMWVEYGLLRRKYPAEPFMRPTYDGTVAQVEAKFADVMRDGLEEAIKN